jgi:hypothetical protein
MIATLNRLDVVRLAADYSAAIRGALTDNQLSKVRSGDAIADDYTDPGHIMAEAIYSQRPNAESIADYADEMTEAHDRAEASGFHLSTILVACEYSATVRDTFAARGHYAISCDVLPSDNPSGHHYQGDIRDIMNDGYELMIAHPPCTFIAACQLWRCQRDPAREAKRQESLELVRDIAGAKVGRACIENPKSCIGTENAAPGFTPQMVQPYEFGHDHSKQTYLWRRDLPELIKDPADFIPGRDAVNNNGAKVKRWGNQCDGSGADRMGPSKSRGHKRSRFFQGFANAMADQWGGITAPLRAPATVQQLGQLALF